MLAESYLACTENCAACEKKFAWSGDVREESNIFCEFRVLVVVVSITCHITGNLQVNWFCFVFGGRFMPGIYVSKIRISVARESYKWAGFVWLPQLGSCWVLQKSIPRRIRRSSGNSVSDRFSFAFRHWTMLELYLCVSLCVSWDTSRGASTGGICGLVFINEYFMWYIYVSCMHTNFGSMRNAYCWEIYGYRGSKYAQRDRLQLYSCLTFMAQSTHSELE